MAQSGRTATLAGGVITVSSAVTGQMQGSQWGAEKGRTINEEEVERRMKELITQEQTKLKQVSWKELQAIAEISLGAPETSEARCKAGSELDSSLISAYLAGSDSY
jgi:primosomal protein N''